VGKNDFIMKFAARNMGFKDGEFKLLLGNLPKNFDLPFEEYKEEMINKYGEQEFDFMVPIED
jgi:hypothetical protein